MIRKPIKQIEIDFSIRAHVFDTYEIARAVADKNLPIGVLNINLSALTDWARKTNCPNGTIFGVLITKDTK